MGGLLAVVIMKLLNPESFRKLCFDILKKYTDKDNHFVVYWDTKGVLMYLTLFENPLRDKKDFGKLQTKIRITPHRAIKYLDPVSKEPFCTLSELINLLEKDKLISIVATIKNEKKVSSDELVGRLFDKYLLIKKKSRLFSDIVFSVPFFGYTVYEKNTYRPQAYEYFEFYLLDNAEAVLYLL